MVQRMDEWLQYIKEFEISGTCGDGCSSERLARVVFGCRNSNTKRCHNPDTQNLTALAKYRAEPSHQPVPILSSFPAIET